MCDLCRCYPCYFSCPNAPEPEGVYTCESCKEDIVVGDTNYKFEGEYYHEECFKDNAVEILLENGAEKGEAERDDIYDY